MAFQMREFPEFSWSQSRDGLLKDCARKYYYHYYASHNGWHDSATDQQRKAYLLKQLVNLHLVLGTVIHNMAHDVIGKIKAGDPYDQATGWNQKVRDYLNQAYKDSKMLQQWKKTPKKFIMLHEMYYEQALPAPLVDQIKAKIEPCVRNFFASETVREMLAMKEIVILEAEEMKTTPFENEKMYVIPDLFYKRPDGKYVIVDWKTGKEYDQNEDQTLLYAMYASEHYGVAIDDIEIRLEYLYTGAHKIIRPTLKRMQDVKQWVRESMDQMKRMLEHAEQNKPLPESFFPAKATAFKCKSCNFREICPDRAEL